MNILKVPDKIRDRLYQTVLGLFSERDFHQVNIREISRESGISIGTIYKYFSSKEDLLFSIIEEYLGQLNVLIRTHVQGIENPKEIFRKIFWITMDFYDRNPGVAITGFITVPTKTWMLRDTYRMDDVRDVLGEILARVKKSGGINPDLDERTLNSLYFMFCNRLVNIWYYHGMKGKLTELLSEYFEYFWRIIELPSGQTRK